MNVIDRFRCLRVVDVVDAMDGIGCLLYGLMDTSATAMVGHQVLGASRPLRAFGAHVELDTPEDIV